MNTVAFLATRAVVAGLLVLTFSVVGEVVKPKRFAGIFGAAPAVALANLALVVAVEGTPKAAPESKAMIIGGLAMVIACAVGVGAVKRSHALKGSGVIVATWIVVAGSVAALAY